MGRYPLAEIVLFYILHIIVFYPTRHHAYRIIIIAGMVYLTVKLYLSPETATPPQAAYSIGIPIGLYFGFTVYLLLLEGSFPNHWRRVRDEVHDGKADGVENLPSNFPLTKKLKWMVDIAHSSRMVGWVQEPRDCLPPHPPPSRLSFLGYTLSKFIVNVVLFDLVTSVFAQNPVFDSRVHAPTDGPETYLAAVPLFRRVPYALAFALWTAIPIQIIHNVGALVIVGIGCNSPTLWPDVWGRWRDAYTLRKLWGCVF